jgi:transcriptional regulator with XRE-family HTH domain
MRAGEKIVSQLRRWRDRNKLTQVEAASLLGISQPYLSLIESGARPLTAAIRGRIGNAAKHEVASRDTVQEAADQRFRRQLSALEYPGFAHIARARSKPRAEHLLLAVLTGPDVDARIVEALPWLVRQHAGQMNLPWLVRRARMENRQNRLGFVLALSRVKSSSISTALSELDRARLLEEATLCWDSMAPATRAWMRTHRSPLAQYWNVLTRLDSVDSSHAA